ncbi:hypothetical protein [Streptomyces johnsoniae]|uniref:HNH endonuclease n=1 Tax=Streptomyces johnsoniae TaxID=3075532 RepID=A0ABU2RYL3_9ACTN|nr:hypothetical protein [Streptomyces sp. DSM 41886]MDT0441846.1 hypothetical protein [Streptomyces sp. DSM 41886]
MPTSDCRHPGTLDRRDDGAHCRYCNTLIYPAAAPAEPPPEPGPVPAGEPRTASRHGQGAAS